MARNAASSKYKWFSFVCDIWLLTKSASLSAVSLSVIVTPAFSAASAGRYGSTTRILMPKA